MKISKKVWIDSHVKWNVLKKRELCKKNRYKGKAYIVCTSPHKHLLFEIVEARFLCQHYDDAILLAVCHSKKQAVMQVATLVDRLYNKQTIAYNEL